MIQHISAVTLAVQDMARSVEFYEKLGPEVIYGGGYSAFTTLRSGEAFVNLIAAPGYEGRWWGRVFFGSMTLMPTIRVLLWQDSDLRYRRMHHGASDSSTYTIRTGTSSASRSC